MNENITKQAKDLFDKVYNVNVGVVEQVKIPSLYVHEANKDFNFQVAGAGLEKLFTEKDVAGLPISFEEIKKMWEEAGIE